MQQMTRRTTPRGPGRVRGDDLDALGRPAGPSGPLVAVGGQPGSVERMTVNAAPCGSVRTANRP